MNVAKWDLTQPAPGEDGAHQPGKTFVTAFVSAVTLVLTLGFLGHTVGLL